MLTFNPGWGQDMSQLDEFQDVRKLEKSLREAGVEITSSNTADKDAGPAHITLVDPDGNPILIDQHR